MGVYIKGMEMPKSCDVCDFVYGLNVRNLGVHNYCSFPGIGVCVDDYIAARHKECPLGNVPTPHGRLGDLDELYNHLNERYLTHEHGFSETEKIYIRAMLSGVKDSPTVIPESKEG